MEEADISGFSPALADEIKARFPILRALHNNDRRFQRLIVLINEIGSANPEREEKYAFMYKVVQMGNLAKLLAAVPERPNVNLAVNDSDFRTLSDEQQILQFKRCRNYTGHFGHAIYRDDAIELLKTSVSLCQGRNSSRGLLAADNWIRRLKRSRDLVEVLNSDQRSFKLLAQMVYFLRRAKQFIDINSHAAAMAYVWAGNCAKDFCMCISENMKERFSVEKLNAPMLVDLLVEREDLHIKELLEFLVDMEKAREPFAHCYEKETWIEEERLFAQLKITLDRYDMEFESIKNLIEKYFVGKCRDRVNEVFGDNFETTFENTIAREDDESPRSYDKGLLRR